MRPLGSPVPTARARLGAMATDRTTTDDTADDREAGPLGTSSSTPTGEDPDAMAGPVVPAPETEPDASEKSRRRSL